WKPPESEDAWAECLSAYLDGELSPEERQGLERRLELEPARAVQLRGLKAMSEALRLWHIEAPEADPAFVGQCERVLADREQVLTAQTERCRPFFSRFRWQAQAALFLLGALTGITGTLLCVWARGGQPAQHPAAFSRVLVQPVIVMSAVSPQQAQGLFREVAAEDLKRAMLDNLHAARWDAALETYETLRTEYGDTAAAREMGLDPTLRRLKKGRVPLGRT
ncbi:MAG TPA: hypothetical protein HPP83_09410, partial [Candidatus Hydrogenedentes bacterium]|nr:hypothetical protein [Candidatus Hydrogenedentota bacterium]